MSDWKTSNPPLDVVIEFETDEGEFGRAVLQESPVEDPVVVDGRRGRYEPTGDYLLLWKDGKDLKLIKVKRWRHP